MNTRRLWGFCGEGADKKEEYVDGKHVGDGTGLNVVCIIVVTVGNGNGW